jgi:hypothetical protein
MLFLRYLTKKDPQKSKKPLLPKSMLNNPLLYKKTASLSKERQ